jgi:hypothetical protein
MTRHELTNKTATITRDVGARNIPVASHHQHHPLLVVVLCIRPLFIRPLLSRTSSQVPSHPATKFSTLRSNRNNEVRQEPQQPDRGDAPGLARQVPVLQGPQEAAEADRRRLWRAAEQAPAGGGRARRILAACDDPGGGRIRRAPRRRARQVQRLLPREGGGLRHPAEGN